ncbi:TetR family transcriptional regulator [Dactylosporangium sp. NPDC005572]|uniref:TetR family transcriptional regulator n=1 Tax=Dactylosporangium sp. NPDC005572 TaxID=3156889 RepID=UPI00339FAEC4
MPTGKVPREKTTERLSRATVAERALRIGDEEGLDAVTVRRLATDLGVTPMALYWHFKNKDELLAGIADHVLRGVRADRSVADPWETQLRAMVQALVDAMRAHPCLSDLLFVIDKNGVESFTRATDDALALLCAAGFTLEEAWWVASHLLHATIGLVAAQPGCPPGTPPEAVGEWLRQRRLHLESMPADRYPMMVELAGTYAHEPDLDRYYTFGVELVMDGVEKMAASRRVASVDQQ